MYLDQKVGWLDRILRYHTVLKTFEIVDANLLFFLRIRHFQLFLLSIQPIVCTSWRCRRIKEAPLRVWWWQNLCCLRFIYVKHNITCLLFSWFFGVLPPAILYFREVTLLYWQHRCDAYSCFTFFNLVI